MITNNFDLKNFALPLSLAAVLLVAIPAWRTFLPERSRDARETRQRGNVIHETVSDFSRIRVREREGVRSLIFVDKNGQETLQSQIDLNAPHELKLRYSRAMFASLLFREGQDHVLVVGLGGGGMVRFMNHSLPETRVDAVEIDPEVVRIAAEYFGTSDNKYTTIYTEYAFVFLREPNGPYDVIYMDAFLRPPSELTVEDKIGRLKTVEFLREIQMRLKPGGIVAFNLIESDPSTADDLKAIQSAFSSVSIFSVEKTGNLAVMASMEETPSRAELLERVSSVEKRFSTGLPFVEIVEGRRPE